MSVNMSNNRCALSCIHGEDNGSSRLIIVKLGEYHYDVNVDLKVASRSNRCNRV